MIEILLMPNTKISRNIDYKVEFKTKPDDIEFKMKWVLHTHIHHSIKGLKKFITHFDRTIHDIFSFSCSCQ